MPAIHFHNVSFRYSSAIPVFDDLSVSLGSGWVGVVGANGAGKTTLLRLIDSTLQATGGRVELDPSNAIVVRCPQTADDIDDNISKLANSWDGEAHVLLGRLELNRGDLDRWPTLSPGERKRWQVAGALYQRPDVLLLDEPTNHLDKDARQLLLGVLRRYGGVGVVVSHDREVLNDLCRRTLRVEPGAVSLWQSGYDVARQGWEAEETAVVEEYQRVQSQRKKVERRLGDKRRTAAQKESQRKRELRGAAPANKDIRSMAAKAKFEGGQKQASHEMRLLRDEAERLRTEAADFEMRRRLGGELFFDFEPSRRPRLLSFTGPLHVGDQILVPDVDVAIGRDDRILLAGPNGAGKTTLLRALLAESTLEPDRILYMPQELTRQETKELVASFDALDSRTRGRVLGIVGVLGSDPKRVLATELPSPGEARKLLLAMGLGRGAWLLLLDEPTNHLDLPSVERLENALAAYPGAIVVVTHDGAFARETTTSTWTIEEGRIAVG